MTLQSYLVTAQGNLVLNPSFEDSTGTMWQYSNSNPNYYHICKFWDNPTFDTPDYYYNYNTQGGAHNGIAYCGMDCYEEFSSNIREYIQGESNVILTQNNIYNFSFFLRLDTISKWKICTLQVAFLTARQYTPASTCLSFSSAINIDISTVSTNNWIKCTGTYTAFGGEKYFIIGNMIDQSQISCKSIINATTQISASAYYRIDGIELINSGSNNITEISLNNIKIYPNPILDKIYFQYFEEINFILITNTLGEIVKEVRQPIANYISIDELVDDVYFIRFQTAKGIFNKKIIIHRQ